MGKESAYDYIRKFKRATIFYIENGRRKQKTENPEEVIKFLLEIEKDKNKKLKEVRLKSLN